MECSFLVLEKSLSNDPLSVSKTDFRMCVYANLKREDEVIYRIYDQEILFFLNIFRNFVGFIRWIY